VLAALLPAGWLKVWPVMIIGGDLELGKAGMPGCGHPVTAPLAAAIVGPYG